MSAKHTPRPWAVSYLDKNGQRVVMGEHIEICTCWHHCVGSIELEMEENARLIAAAPDLLEALKDTLRILDAVRYTAGLGKGQMERADKARAAIAKAEGGL